jgi:hypothetical protein
VKDKIPIAFLTVGNAKRAVRFRITREASRGEAYLEQMLAFALGRQANCDFRDFVSAYPRVWPSSRLHSAKDTNSANSA